MAGYFSKTLVVVLAYVFVLIALVEGEGGALGCPEVGKYVSGGVNGGLPGSPFENFPDWQTCGNKCNDEADCVAFMYTAGDKKCHLARSILFNEGYIGSQGPAYAGLKGCPGCEDRGQRYGGDTLRSEFEVKNWEACGRACNDESDCKAWTYYTQEASGSDARKCYLRKSYDGKTDHDYGVGGLKGCPAPTVAVAGPKFENAVTCDARGFRPTFKYKLASTTEQQVLKVEVVLGTDDSVTWCTGQSSASPTSVTGSVSVNKDNIDPFAPAFYVDRIPYQQGVDGKDGTAAKRCGGKLEHWTETEVKKEMDNTASPPAEVDVTYTYEKIKYEVTAYAIVTRRFRGKIDRVTKHPFTIRCDLLRDVTTSSDKGFTVATALVAETEGDATTSDFNYVASLTLYSDSGYSTEATTDLEINNNAPVYFMIEQGDNQVLFKYVVDKCTATVGKTNPNPTASKNDVFFDGQCPKDSTVTTDFGNIATDHKFKIQTGAFSFNGEASSNVYFHCDLTVCLDTDGTTACTQKADCGDSQINDNRRRRSAESGRRSAENGRRSAENGRRSAENGRRSAEGGEGVIGTKTISSQHSVLIRAAEILTPSCGPGFIYDRVLKRCSNENLLEIRGIYLGAAAWDPAYANVTSDAFKSMVAVREYQLWVVLEVTQRTSYIHGVQVVRARQGSVILDVLIKHAPTVSAKEAFEQFDEALRTKPSVTRVMDVLQIREGKTIEFVPVIAVGGAERNFDVLILVVVVALVLVVNIAGVLLFKMRRQRSANNNNNSNNNNNNGVHNVIQFYLIEQICPRKSL